MPQFTKGKWTIKKLLAGLGVFAVNEGSREPVADCLDNEANARLIAEAPVMYDLLNKAFHILGKNAANDAICREIDECLSRVDGAPVQEKKGE